jgi:hypothetical protein
MIGSRGECIPTIRVGAGTFDQLREVLQAQARSGLGTAPKSAGPAYSLVCLLEHLCRVGAQEYWLQLDSFSTWVEKEFGWIVVPFLPPFPKGLDNSSLVSINQFLTILKGKFMGDFQGNFVNRFCMWRPLSKFMASLSIKKIDLSIPPVFLLSEGKEKKILECNQSEWAGVDVCFDDRSPIEVESKFLPLMLNELSALPPPSSPLNIPSDVALLGGFHRGNTRDLDLPPPPVSTIFLMGTSILSQVADPLRKATQNAGINVVNSCKGGDFLVNFKNMDIPTSNNENDTLILHFLGNNILNKKKFDLKNGIFHLELPGFLNDKDVESLISKVVTIISKIRLHFKGKIKLIGAFPRHLTPCCSLPSHSLKPSCLFPSPMHYFLYIDQYFSLHPLLRIENVEFICFTSILGPILPKDLLTDQVHLSPAATNKYVSFLSQIQGRRVVIKPALPEDRSFFSWVDKKSLSNLIPLIQKRNVVPTQKPAPRPPVAVIGPSTAAAPRPQNAPPPIAQPAQPHLAALDAQDNIADNRMVEDMEYLLDQPDPDNVEFIYNVEAALALLEVVTDDEQDI